MSAILPIHELESPPAPPENPTADFPQTDPNTFSVPLAARLADLCAEAETTNAPVIIKQQSDHLFIAFRSHGDPAKIFNIRGATQTIAIPHANGLAYGPLLNAYRESAQTILTTLPNASKIWLTGHGIGAAFALFAAAGLADKVAAVYTFGAPRAANSALTIQAPVFRIVNNLDVMVTMPTAWHWRHIGHHKLITATGRLNAKPNMFNRIPGLTSQTLWLGEMLKQGITSGFPRALYTLLKQVLHDHALTTYCARLHALNK